MKFIVPIILSSYLIAVQAQMTEEIVIINGVRHQKEILHDNLDSPSRLAMDYTTNDLYLTYKTGEDYYSAKLNVNTGEFKDIEGVTDGTGVAVDQDTQDVYIGGLDGIYKYNISTNKVDLVGNNGENNRIWNMFFKNILYFVALPSNVLYTFINGQCTRFEDIDRKVDKFVIDNEDVMYFSFYENFYRQKKGTNETIIIKDVPYVRALNTDKHGKVYACSYNGIYKAVGHSAKFTKVVNDVDATGIAFDSDNNMIYSYKKKIVRLKPIRILPPLTSASQ